MAITFNQIRYFCEVAEAGHFGRAARRLHISQPPLSRQIAALESALGLRLFERSSKGAVVTAAGQQFLLDAQKILHCVRLAEQNAKAVANGMTGTLMVGFTSCAAYSIAPLIAKRFKALYPRVELVMREFLPNLLESSVKDGTIDAGISFPEVDTETLVSQTIIREPLQVALPSIHKLAKARRIQLCNLADESFVMAPRTASPSLFDTILNHCLAAGFYPNIVLEPYLQQTILNFVAEGLGIALVPKSMGRSRLDGVCFRELADAPIIEQRLMWNRESNKASVMNLRSLCESERRSIIMALKRKVMP